MAEIESLKSIGVVRLDNVQNYPPQRNLGIRHQHKIQNKLNIALAATYYEIEDVDIFDRGQETTSGLPLTTRAKASSSNLN